ncbi:(2Fe-2S)-binding protein [Rhodococcus erythropolis]
MSPSHKLPITRGENLEISFGGHPVSCHAGDTVAAALLTAGVHEFGITRTGDPRQPFCNMGTCFDCVVTINGHPLVRACMTTVRSGMEIVPTKGF